MTQFTGPGVACPVSSGICWYQKPGSTGLLATTKKGIKMKHLTSSQITDLVNNRSKVGKIVYKELNSKTESSEFYSAIVLMNDDGLYYKIDWREDYLGKVAS